MFSVLNHVQNQFLTGNTKTGVETVALYNKLMRYSIAVSDKNLVQLEKEIEFVKLYLKAEDIRFDKTHDFDWTINNTDGNIPSFVFQGITELAVKAMQAEEKERLTIIINQNSIAINCDADKNKLPERYLKKWDKLAERVNLYNQANHFKSELTWAPNGTLSWNFN
jgi:LytS/YehU family sensor histidine kinase